jgi:hypothetical protein
VGCMDGGPSLEQRNRLARDSKTVLRLACGYCRGVEKAGGEVPEWAREWWEFHKLEDEARLRREAEQRRKDDLKKSAMDKLSSEEKAALNIKT